MYVNNIIFKFTDKTLNCCKIEKIGRSPDRRAPIPGGSSRVHLLRQDLQQPAVAEPTRGPVARSGPSLSLRTLRQSVQRPVEPAAPHPVVARRSPGSRVSRVRQNVRYFQWTQAAHAHPLVRQTVPVRGLPQGLHSGKDFNMQMSSSLDGIFE